MGEFSDKSIYCVKCTVKRDFLFSSQITNGFDWNGVFQQIMMGGTWSCSYEKFSQTKWTSTLKKKVKLKIRKFKKIDTLKDTIWMLWKLVCADSCCDGYGGIIRSCFFCTHMTRKTAKLTFIWFPFHFMRICLAVGFFSLLNEDKKQKANSRKLKKYFILWFTDKKNRRRNPI